MEQFGDSYEDRRAKAIDSGISANSTGRQRCADEVLRWLGDTARICRFLVHEIPFSSARKRSSVVVRTKDGKYRMYMKGASEIVGRVAIVTVWFLDRYWISVARTNRLGDRRGLKCWILDRGKLCRLLGEIPFPRHVGLLVVF